MRMKSFESTLIQRYNIHCLLSVVFGVTLAGSLAAQNSSFTYQGELKQNGNLSNGNFDMTFSLWNAMAAGGQQGPTVNVNSVSVVDGIFTVDLDFGIAALGNSERWLQVEVEGFVLSPRTKVTRSPYSIQTRGIFVSSDEKVGIGTSNPQVQLDLESPDESVLRLTTANGNPSSVSRIQLKSFDAPGIFSPLGRIDFVDEQDVTKAFFQGTKAGASDAQLALSVTPAGSPQVTISSNATAFVGDLNTNGNLDVALNLAVGDAMTVASDLTVEDDLFVADIIVAEGDVEVFSNLFVGGSVFLFEELSVSGDVNLGNDLSVQNDLNVAGNYNVGGVVTMGPNGIHPALAYGHVNIDTNTVTASNNILQVAAIGTGRYRIFIDGGFQLGDIILATSENALKNASAKRETLNPTRAIIEIADLTTGQLSSENFSFVVYRK